MQMLQLMMEDREAERAERQANITALQQLAQNNQGRGNHDHPGSRLKNFQNTNPPMFNKTEEPLDADDWLQTIENNLEVAGVEAAEKVLFATHYLSGPARAWWTSARAMNAGQMMTWEKLKFSKYHVPQGLIKKMRDEFRELKQGRMSVVEYRDRNPSKEIFSELDEIFAQGPILHEASRKTEEITSGATRWQTTGGAAGPWPRHPSSSGPQILVRKYSELDEIFAQGPIFARSFQKTEEITKWGHEVARPRARGLAAPPVIRPREPPTYPFAYLKPPSRNPVPRATIRKTFQTPPPNPISGIQEIASGTLPERGIHLPEDSSSP
ncbi:hypothetical protein QYE76_000115 [Lolium multiflorum]|uniref:Retrotransposon gag domain-containing protein n=1 Tax=Lolium multiflorum TaxID=4521 RepID=A0AAD8PI13_LOLMU|nr:hypothetical protein QYE76_000115 [Lolium multiflorum]